MSRIGNKLIALPNGVSINVQNGQISVKGPKGSLTRSVVAKTSVAACLSETNEVVKNDKGEPLWKVSRSDDSKSSRAYHGLMRALLANMVTGVSKGFSKELDVIGVGYKAELKGKTLVLNLGYSHPINFKIPDGLSIKVDQGAKSTQITVVGIDKEKVGQAAAEIRSFRKPDSYKGKGVRYKGEHVRLKAGKTQ
jgi:large subunit ribosomal protein L6